MLEASKSFFYPMPLSSWILNWLEKKLFVLGILNSSQDLKLLWGKEEQGPAWGFVKSAQISSVHRQEI
jgi:hypothetical protein